MANVRDSDTSLWLHNKLGTSNDSWTGGSICSQLNSEVLRNIKECFPDLQTQVKLKLLLSFFQIPHKNIQEVSIRLRILNFNISLVRSSKLFVHITLRQSNISMFDNILSVCHVRCSDFVYLIT